MPDLNGRKVASKSDALGKLDSSTKTSHSSSLKTGDKRRPEREPLRSAPKRRGVRRSRSSSSGTSDSSSSGSDSSDSSDSASSHSSKESPKKTVPSKTTKEAGRSKPQPRSQKPKPESNLSTKPDDTRAQREPPKKSTSDVPKVNDSTTRTDSSQNRSKPNIEETTAAPHAVKPIAAPVDEKSEPSPKSQSISKTSSKPSKPETDKTNKERSKSPASIPAFTRVLVEKLTRNVNKAHVTEIFSVWGEILNVEMPPDRLHPEFSRSYAYVTYKDPKCAADAVNFMNGGQVDGETIRVSEIFSRPSTSARGEATASEYSQYRDRGPVKRDTDRPPDSTRDRRDNLGSAATRRMEDSNERPRDRTNDLDRRRENLDRRDRERERQRERSREMDRPRRAARRGSSGSPFASRPVPRQRSPIAGSRYRRTSPLSSRPDVASRRGKSRSPQRTTKSNLTSRSDGRPPAGRRGRNTSRSSSSSSSGTSNSSSSTSRSSSSSSSSSSSRSRT